MALIKCKECGKEISNIANNCIHCGCPQKELVKDIVSPQKSKNKKETNWKLRLLIGIPILVIGLSWVIYDTLKGSGTSLFSSNSINEIKKGTLNACPNYTIEELINTYMGNVEWAKEKSDKGYDVYNVTGNILYNNEEASALIQFAIDGDDIVVKDFEINKVPQGTSTYSELVSNMCNEMPLLDILVEINTDEYFKKLSSKDKSVIYITNPNCSLCVNYEKKLKESLRELGIRAYYINTANSDNDTDRLSKSLKSQSINLVTPFTLLIGNNKVHAYLSGNVDKSNIQNLLKNMTNEVDNSSDEINNSDSEKKSSNQNPTKEQVEIENYVGKNYLVVKNKLEALGVKVVIEQVEGDRYEEYSNGEIIDQSVREGSTLDTGGTIILYVK